MTHFPSMKPFSTIEIQAALARKRTIGNDTPCLFVPFIIDNSQLLCLYFYDTVIPVSDFQQVLKGGLVSF